jgi:hypothetical protein
MTDRALGRDHVPAGGLQGQGRDRPRPAASRTSAAIPTKEQFQLFPKKPGRKMSYIAGLPKPKGCV